MEQSNAKTRIGILGAGGVAKDLHLPALSNMSEVSISWICDKNEQSAQQLANWFSIPEVFTDIDKCSDTDIVLVAIPVGFRRTVMQKIFERGWHAFCEKPFALTLDECDQYLAQAGENKVQLGVGLVRRYSPAIALAKKLVSEGHFGAVVAAWASEGMRTKRTGKEAGSYMFDPTAVGGGVLMETGSHLVDQLLTVLNATDFSLTHCTQRKFEKLEFETRFVGTVATEKQSDIRCAFEVSKLEDLCNGIFVQFSNLILKCGLGFQGPLELCTLDGVPFSRLVIDEVPENAAFFLEWKDFLTQCATGNPSAISAETARQSISVIEQCYKNAELIDMSAHNTEISTSE